MIKTKNLMIGDWVDVYHELPDESGFYRPLQVTGIHSHDGVCFGHDVLQCPWIDLEEFEAVKPIPLTPEILEKNGFKYSEWYGWQIKEPDFTLCFVGDTPHFLLDDIFVCDCPYVHTLQHAIRLCGIDKEIVL